MLETLQQTNIGNLNLTEPTLDNTDIFFDPEKDLSEKDWEYIKGRISYAFLTPEDGLNFAGIARMLFPKRIAQVQFGESAWQETEQMFKVNLAEFKNLPSLYGYADLIITRASYALLAYPEKSQEIHGWYKQTKDIINQHGQNKFEFFLSQQEIQKFGFAAQQQFITALAIISPEDVPAYPRLEDYKRNWILETDWDMTAETIKWIEQAARFKIAFPNEEVDLSEGLNYLRNKVKRNSKDRNPFLEQVDMLDFLETAFYLKVLAAEKVIVTDQGLELTMPEPKQPIIQDTPQLPEVRKF